MHPVVIYYKDIDELKLKSYCFISEDLKHDDAIVNIFLEELIPKIKELIPGLKNVLYFSDGRGEQYKNCENLLWLCQHESKFNIQVTWKSFATM